MPTSLRRYADLKAALLIVDPLNHAHGFDDGNNNVLIAKVAAEMNRIAWESGAAVLVCTISARAHPGWPMT